jgi:hypothetical protein
VSGNCCDAIEVNETGGNVEIAEIGTAVFVAGDGASGPPIRPTYNPTGIYALPNPPIDPSKVMVFVNGAKQVYGIDYTIGGTVLTWASPNLALSSTDIFEVYP